MGEVGRLRIAEVAAITAALGAVTKFSFWGRCYTLQFSSGDSKN